MKRYCVFFTCWLCTFGLVQHAAGEVADKQSTGKGYYQRIDPPFPTQAGNGQIEVLEFFLYACPHCNGLEQRLPEWLKSNAGKVVLRRVPAIVGPPWAEQARVFYTAEMLGVLDKAHGSLFKSIHEENRRYGDEQSIQEFFTQLGVPTDKFHTAYHSPEVAGKVSQARVMTVEYGIQSVPAVVINGKYKIEQHSNGGQDGMLEMMDILTARELDAGAQGSGTDH